MKAMIEAIVWGAAVAALTLPAAGVRRLPWSYAGLLALGFGIVFTALRLAQLGADAASLVLVAAVGAALAATAWERGNRERVRRSAAILGVEPR
jgi:hypothetical protein